MEYRVHCVVHLVNACLVVCFLVVDKCVTEKPCQNGGVCSEGTGDYKCTCKADFAGLRCERTYMY